MISMKVFAAALAVVVGMLGGFYGGYHTGKNSPPAPAAAAATSGTGGQAATGGGQGATGQQGAGLNGGGFGRGQAGTISAVTASGFTLHSARAGGSDVKVSYAGNVTVRKTATGSLSDITDGATVTIQGQVAADGSFQATSITIVPATAAGG